MKIIQKAKHQYGVRLRKRFAAVILNNRDILDGKVSKILLKIITECQTFAEGFTVSLTMYVASL